jgi:hypothetical protein
MAFFELKNPPLGLASGLRKCVTRRQTYGNIFSMVPSCRFDAVHNSGAGLKVPRRLEPALQKTHA